MMDHVTFSTAREAFSNKMENLMVDNDEDNDEAQQDIEKEMEHSLDGGRRLRGVNSDMTSKSHKKVSISLQVKISPKNSKNLAQGAKDNKRFLNYGPRADTCLWNAFHTQQVSSGCASALTYINDSYDSKPFEYDDEPKTITRISLSFSGLSLFWILVSCMLTRMLWLEYQIDEDEDDEDEDQLDSEHDGYKLVDESENVAFAALPVRVV